MIATGVPLVGFAVLIGVEILIARQGMEVTTPTGINGCYGCTPDGPAPQRIAYLGDSTVAGTGASGPEGTVPVQVAGRLARPVQVLDLGVSGSRVGDVLDQQIDSRLVDFQPDVIVISVGANDAVHLTSRGRYRSQYRRVVERLPPEAEVVLLGVPDLGSPPRFAQPLRAIAGWRGRQLDDDIRNLAEDVGAAYVEIDALGPEFRTNDALFAADNYHPSDAGYGRWADLIAPVIPVP